MEDFQKIQPVTRLKRNLLDIVKNMEEENTTIAITRNGEAVAVLMTLERYEALMETIEVLSDKEIMQALETSMKDFKAGRVSGHDEVWEE